MSKTGRPNHRRGQRGTRKAERRIVVRSVRREPPDLRKLSRAIIAMALREAETDAELKEARRVVPPIAPESAAEQTDSRNQEAGNA